MNVVLLFLFDGLANVIDYAFHIFLGRTLTPGDFADFQTINAAFLVVVTGFGVMQPVVSRFVAGTTTTSTPTHNLPPEVRGMFRTVFRLSILVGIIAGVGVWLMRSPIAANLGVPVWSVGAIAWAVALVFSRPVLMGMLQGMERFVAYGMMRVLFAGGRLVSGVLLVLLGYSLFGALAAVSLGMVAAVFGGLVMVGVGVWRAGTTLGLDRAWEMVRLSLAALFAYLAHTTLLSADLFWVNRAFPAETAGLYASGVLLRRILLLLPGVVTIVLFPRVAAAAKQFRTPDRDVWFGVGIVMFVVLAGTGAYIVMGEWLLGLMFGGGYAAAAVWLGWMGVAILGYSLGTVWMNVFLASRPWPYVILLVVTLGGLRVLFPLWGTSILSVLQVFALGGAVLAIGGGLLYVFWLRNQLVSGYEG